jgi:hypothetical protein
VIIFVYVQHSRDALSSHGLPTHRCDPTVDVICAINNATTALNATIQQAVSVTTQDPDVNIVYVDVTAQFAQHGIGSPVPFINATGPDAFTRMPLATGPMPMPSSTHCRGMVRQNVRSRGDAIARSSGGRASLVRARARARRVRIGVADQVKKIPGTGGSCSL